MSSRRAALALRHGRTCSGAGPTIASATSLGWAFVWLPVGVLLYTHVGYPLVVALAARRRRRSETGAPPENGQLPNLAVVVPALDEEALIAAKIENIAAQGYPSEKLDLVVVADGSADGTAAIARSRGAKVVWCPERQGKSAAVNRGVAAVRAPIVCITDANCLLAPGTLQALAAPFADPGVAVVGGTKRVVGDGARGVGEGLYWRLETRLGQHESALRCTMSVPGEVCAFRRGVFGPIPDDVINDDFHLVCEATRRRYAVRHAPNAVACELVSSSMTEEFERRSRIAAGTWQVTLAHLELLDPRRGWVSIAFASHRVLRSLVVPLLLPVLLAASAVLASSSPGARRLLMAQLMVYAMGLVGMVTDDPRLAAPSQFLLTNVATVRGAWRYVTGRQPVTWRKARRPDPGEGAPA
jgi:cellulose synthase/poly-beta-1,6-N-acetylglucosamine synthase-like glycosyltransferase